MDLTFFLSSHGIYPQIIEHPAVFTCAESEKLPPMPGMGTKNLFLVSENGDRVMLVVVQHGRRTDLKGLAVLLGERRVSFGSAELLKELLGVDPGSVTLLGLLYDGQRKVELFVDRPIWAAESIQCHPLRNTATAILPHNDLVTFLDATGHGATVIGVPYCDAAHPIF